MIRPRIESGAAEGKRHLDELVFTLLANGFANSALPYGMSNLCYDGQYFFDSDHSEGESGTQSNVGSAAYSLSAVATAVGGMMSIKSDEGKLLGVIPDTLVVCPLDYLQAVVDCASANLVAASTAQLAIGNLAQGNPLAKLGLKVVTSPYAIPVISSVAKTHSWYLLCTRSPIKPLVAQTEVPMELQEISDPNSEYVVRNNKFFFGGWASYNVGFGLWQMAYGSVA
jgi:phage major head subunit gpT-like protein